MFQKWTDFLPKKIILRTLRLLPIRIAAAWKTMAALERGVVSRNHAQGGRWIAAINPKAKRLMWRSRSIVPHRPGHASSHSSKR